MALGQTFEAAESSIVVFLGAGASASVTEKVVVTSNLLRAALLEETPPDDAPHRRVRRFLDFLSSGLPERWPTVDDLLALLDVCIDSQLPLSAAWAVRDLVDVRHDVEDVIAACVERALHAHPLPGNALHVLLERLGAYDQAAVVSLNWDCLAEIELSRACREPHEWQRVLSYGIPCFDLTYAGDTLVSRRVDPSPGALPLLKPHGSLSWSRCPLCASLFVRLDLRRRETACCPHCRTGVELERVLVPPITPTRLHTSLLGGLWSRAEDLIATASRLVFVGYSLPPQDVHVRARLVRAIQRNRAAKAESAHRLLVQVVDREGAKETDAMKTFRYRSLFEGHCDLELQFLPGGLTEWLFSGRGI